MANPLWHPDGTQPPPAPQAWEDPVSGLVTGGRYEQDRFSIDVAKPVMPDMSEVRRQVDAALSAEEEASKPLIPAPRREPEAHKDTPGIVVPNPRPGWPRTPSVRRLPGLRPKSGPPPRVQKIRGRQGSSLGIGAVVAMILVFAAIVLVALGSLVNMVSALFN